MRWFGDKTQTEEIEMLVKEQLKRFKRTFSRIKNCSSSRNRNSQMRLFYDKICFNEEVSNFYGLKKRKMVALIKKTVETRKTIERRDCIPRQFYC